MAETGVAPAAEGAEAGARLLDVDGLQALIAALRADGRAVIGPRVRDGAICLDEVDSVDQLPTGWRDEQDAGRYRLTATDSPLMFAHAAPAQSWRSYLQPPRRVLWQVHRTDDGTMFEPVQDTPPAYAFLGLRSCDLAALAVSDRTMGAVDPDVAQRRAGAFTIVVTCTHPSGVCFCTSVGTGPAPAFPHDLALIELLHEGEHWFLATAGSAQGATMLDRLPSAPSDAAVQRAAVEAVTNAEASMGRSLSSSAPAAAAAHPDHPHYDDIASRCLACSNCTLVCPTCFCGGAVDSSSLDGSTAERSWQWDSCFNDDFSLMHGGSVRVSTKSRYRQWLLHKLHTWEDQFDIGGCVGCGRCIAWCPAGIDLTVEIAALADPPEDSP